MEKRVTGMILSHLYLRHVIDYTHPLCQGLLDVSLWSRQDTIVFMDSRVVPVARAVYPIPKRQGDTGDLPLISGG